MANKASVEQELNRLKIENRRLAEENKRLNELSVKNNKHSKRDDSHFFRSITVFCLVLFAVILLFAGNILFWAGNTIVKTDRYVSSVQPLIRQPEIQAAVSSYASQQIFKSVDAESITEQSLPPRAAFLAPTLSDKLQENTHSSIQKLISSPRFEERWSNVQKNAHDKFINGIKQNGSDGALDINEFYKQISDELKTTKLSFLADKSLPPKVGTIQLVSGGWISRLHTVINNIDTWRTIALLLLLASSSLAVWVSRNRRNTVIKLGLLFSAGMFISLILVRISREIIANKVDDQYSAAASQAAQTVLQPLQIQTATILAFGLLISFIAWVSGPSKNAARLTSKIQLLLNGSLHGAIFSKENWLTLMFGRHKHVFQWAVIAMILGLLLFIRLTPGTLITLSFTALFLILLIEVISANNPDNLTKVSE